MKMKVTQPGREEGNAKEEGKSKHQHKHTWPRTGKPQKARKEKTEADGNGTRPTEEGGGRKRLNQPTTAKPKPTSARAGPNLPGERKNT